MSREKSRNVSAESSLARRRRYGQQKETSQGKGGGQGKGAMRFLLTFFRILYLRSDSAE